MVRVGKGCRGVWAPRWCRSCLTRSGNVHAAAEGARVTAVEAVVALRVAWRVTPRRLLMEGGVGIDGAGPQRSASSCTLVDGDGQLRSWQWVPQWLVQAQV